MWLSRRSAPFAAPSPAGGRAGCSDRGAGQTISFSMPAQSKKVLEKLGARPLAAGRRSCRSARSRAAGGPAPAAATPRRARRSGLGRRGGGAWLAAVPASTRARSSDQAARPRFMSPPAGSAATRSPAAIARKGRVPSRETAQPGNALVPSNPCAARPGSGRPRRPAARERLPPGDRPRTVRWCQKARSTKSHVGSGASASIRSRSGISRGSESVRAGPRPARPRSRSRRGRRSGSPDALKRGDGSRLFPPAAQEPNVREARRARPSLDRVAAHAMVAGQRILIAEADPPAQGQAPKKGPRRGIRRPPEILRRLSTRERSPLSKSPLKTVPRPQSACVCWYQFRRMYSVSGVVALVLGSARAWRRR